MKKLFFMAVAGLVLAGCNGGGNATVEKENVGGNESAVVNNEKKEEGKKEVSVAEKGVNNAKRKVVKGSFMSRADALGDEAALKVVIGDGKIAISRVTWYGQEEEWKYEGRYVVAKEKTWIEPGGPTEEKESETEVEIECKLKRAGAGKEFDARLTIDSLGKNHAMVCFISLDCDESEPISRHNDSCTDVFTPFSDGGKEWTAYSAEGKGNLGAFVSDMYAITQIPKLAGLAKYIKNPSSGDGCRATVDFSGGYATYACDGEEGGSECTVCYWNVEGGALVGLTTNADGHGSFAFFKYDQKRGVYERQLGMLKGLKDESGAIPWLYVELPRKGKDVKAEYEGKEILYSWNGRGFDRVVK